jgi:hypothetical protein
MKRRKLMQYIASDSSLEQKIESMSTNSVFLGQLKDALTGDFPERGPWIVEECSDSCDDLSFSIKDGDRTIAIVENENDAEFIRTAQDKIEFLEHYLFMCIQHLEDQ